MPHGTHGAELSYYKTTLFEGSAVKAIDLSVIEERRTQVIFERHHYYPADYFFFRIRGAVFFGRKTLSTLYLEGKQPFKKCNQIKANMFIGMIIRTQTTEEGVIFFYKPIDNEEKIYLFNQIKFNPKTEIYYPFPVLSKDLKEYVQSADAWDVTEALAGVLNAGESDIRRYTLEFLKGFDLKGKKIYDPACSTGEFLKAIKNAYPDTYVIGQDINPDMLELAKKHSELDELHLGNALYPCVEKESVDFIFFRFLNLSVVSADMALKLFCKLSNCCKTNGVLVVFGFTPVLLSAEIFEVLGMEVKQGIAYSELRDSIFQYYVLIKKSPIPMTRYKDFAIFKLAGEGHIVEHKHPVDMEGLRPRL